MFGPRITTVFRSKWRALWFAASVLAGVYWSIPKSGDQNDPDAEQAARAVAGLIQPSESATPAQHVNPWAKTAR